MVGKPKPQCKGRPITRPIAAAQHKDFVSSLQNKKMKLISNPLKKSNASSKQMVTKKKRLSSASSWADSICQKASFVGKNSMKRPISSISSIFDKYEEKSPCEKITKHHTRRWTQNYEHQGQNNEKNGKYYNKGHIESSRSKKQKIDNKVNKKRGELAINIKKGQFKFLSHNNDKSAANKSIQKKIEKKTKETVRVSAKHLIGSSGVTNKLTNFENKTSDEKESHISLGQSHEFNQPLEKNIGGEQDTATNDIQTTSNEAKNVNKNVMEYQTYKKDDCLDISANSLTLNLKQKNQQIKSWRFSSINHKDQSKVLKKNNTSNEKIKSRFGKVFVKSTSKELTKPTNIISARTTITQADLNISKERSTIKHLDSNTNLLDDLKTKDSIPNQKEQISKANNTTIVNPYSLSSNRLRISSKSSSPLKKQVKTKHDYRKYDENDNFLRLNMRNKAGACKGAIRGKKKSNIKKLKHLSSAGADQTSLNSSSERKYMFSSRFSDDIGSSSTDRSEKPNNTFIHSKPNLGMAHNCNTLIDPVDDYLDGIYHNQMESSIHSPPKTQLNQKMKQSKTKKSLSQKEEIIVPKCIRHQRPCVMRTVKTNRSGNRNRKFYACSLPYGESCNHFEWVEDTVSSVCNAIQKSSDYSSFVSRQVSMYAEMFRSLNLPDLRKEAKKRGLKNNVGKKEQVITRLLLWVRDEVMKTGELYDRDKVNENQLSNSEIREGIDRPIDNTSNQQNVVEITSSDNNRTDNTRNEQNVAKVNNHFNDIDSLENTSSDDNDTYYSEDELEIVSDGRRDSIDYYQDKDLLHQSLYRFYGYRSFRGGQEWAIRRCLAGKRTLLVAPTGMGKSMCYILPAGLMEGLTIVVSPLISLMEDQLRQIPPCIPGAVLSGGLSKTKQATIIDDVLKKRLKILFLSPERLASAAFQRLLRPKFNQSTKCYERMLPAISLLCIDEVHCVSQWGHTFRPAYLRLKSLLPLLKPQSLLALTATAGAAVIADICKTLGIKDDFQEQESLLVQDSFAQNHDCVKVLDLSRDNIDVMSIILKSDNERRDILRKMLRERPKTLNEDKCRASNSMPDGILSSGSVIVYVWRQRDAEVIAEQLLIDGVTGGVVFYHGGMDAGARARAQSKFMTGKARVCVATVAFGLGINKSDIEGIIHYCLPPSLEHYVQEIGRAGRDGRNSKAISLITPEDIQSRLSLAHSDGILPCQIGMLMSIIQCEVDKLTSEDITSKHTLISDQNDCLSSGLDLALPISLLTNSIDCKSETIESIFSLMEDEQCFRSPLLNVKGIFYDKATITLKRRPLSKLSKEEPLAQAIENCGIKLDSDNMESSMNQMKHNLATDGGTASQLGFFAYSFGTYQISILRCTKYLGRYAEPRHVFATLRRLQSDGELEIALDTSLSGRCLHIKLSQEGKDVFTSPSKEKETMLCSRNTKSSNEKSENVIRILSSHFSHQEKIRLDKVNMIYNILSQISCLSFDGSLSGKISLSNVENHKMCNEVSRKDLFNQFVKLYFSESSDKSETINKTLHPVMEGNEHLKSHETVPLFVSEISIDDFSDIARLTNDVMTLLGHPSLIQSGQSQFQVQFGSQEFIEYTARSIAKILHGIESPRATTKNWYSHPTWSKWRTTSFSSLNKVILHILRGTTSTNSKLPNELLLDSGDLNTNNRK